MFLGFGIFIGPKRNSFTRVAGVISANPSLSVKPAADRARWLGLVLFALLWFVLCRHLSSEWSLNEQYNYGWFVPFFAAYLFWLRWEDRPKPEVGDRKSAVSGHHGLIIGLAVFALLLLFPVRLFEIANPAWRLLDWAHASIVTGLTLLALWIAGGRPWLRHFAFPIGFFFVAVPWFTAIEEPMVQGLMRSVAALSTEAVNLLGIPAQVEGSVIRLNSGVVGVTEACSGVRSLQTSLMIGLLFGELRRLNVARRVQLVLGTVTIALIANVIRAFFLVWMASTRELAAVDRWHDIAGYAILAAVFLGSIGLSAMLARRELQSGKAKVEEQKPAVSLPFLPSPPSYLLPLLWLLAVEVGVESWYRLHERDLVSQPQWTVRWPESASGYRDLPIDERTRGLLRFDDGRSVAWNADRTKTPDLFSPAGVDSSYLLYFFRWRPGHDSALLANFHRPDVCLPATGWRQTQDHGIRNYPIGPGLTVPFRHFEFVHSIGPGKEQVAQVFYCLWEDRVRRGSDLAGEDREIAPGLFKWTRSDRVRVVLEGRRYLGHQVLEIVFLNTRPIDHLTAEDKFQQLIRELIVPEPKSD